MAERSRKNRNLMKGNEAIAEAAIRAGCRFYAGYPITPQNEIPEYMSVRMPEANGVFIQAESEIASINMVYGAAAAGVRAMTSSSSPGISLKQEGISFLAGTELPSVIVNMQRGGPGLGNIAGSQSDYFQAVKGGGHGDYKLIVYAPYNLQEMWDITMLSFDKADEYRTPVMILCDGILGQMMEPFYPTPYVAPPLPDKSWALTGIGARRGSKNKNNVKANVVKSLYMGDGELEERNKILQRKYREIEQKEVCFERLNTEDAELIIVAYGIAARIALTAMKMLRNNGFKAGIFRPVTLYPFPNAEILNLATDKRKFLTFELNCGQMVEDVKLAVNGKSEVFFRGRAGGSVMTPRELYEEAKGLF